MVKMNEPSGISDNNDYTSGNETLDLKRYLSLFISNWYWFAAALLISLTLAYGINRYSERVYTVSATLLIKDDLMAGTNAVSESVIPGGDIFRSQQNLKNEMGVLKSLRLNDSVIKNLSEFRISYTAVGRRGIVERKMYNNCPFIVFFDSTRIQPSARINLEFISDSTFTLSITGKEEKTRTMKIGEIYSQNGFEFRIFPRYENGNILDQNTSGRYYFNFMDPNDLANLYRSKLSVNLIDKEASIVSLSVTGADPRQEADYLNMLMDVYIKWGLDYKVRTADQTISFIDEQIKIISDSLSRAEDEMEKFRREKGFLDLASEGAIVHNRLERFDNEKSAFELQKQYYNYLSDYLEKKEPGAVLISPSVTGISDELLIRHVSDYSQLQETREKLRFNISENLGSIAAIDRQMEKTRSALSENIRNGLHNINTLIAKVDEKIEAEKMALNTLPSLDREFIKIQRRYDLNNTVYTYLLEKRAESGIAKASKIADNRVIDYASPYSSGLIRPRTRQNYMLAIIFGLIIPMAAIFLIDYFNEKIIDRRDIEKRTKVPVLGYISHSDGNIKIPVIEKPRSSLSESFRAVRTSLKYFVNESQVPVISILSTISSEGKTFISLNLAAITASLGKKVLLVGLDLRKPGLNRVFSMTDNDGMSTFLSGNCGYKGVIHETSVQNLWFAPSGPVPPNPAELIDNDNMRLFIENARKEFDFIILDTPPVAIVTDALLLSKYADINIFIVRQRYTFRSTLSLIEQLRQQGELKNMSIVINDISLSGYYGYGMRYGYSFGFGYTYGYSYYGKGYYGKYGYSLATNGYYEEEKKDG